MIAVLHVVFSILSELSCLSRDSFPPLKSKIISPSSPVPLTLPTIPFSPLHSYFFAFWPPFSPLDSFPPLKSKIISPSSPVPLTLPTLPLSPLHSYFFAFWPPFSPLDSFPPPKSKKVRTSALPSHPAPGPGKTTFAHGKSR